MHHLTVTLLVAGLIAFAVSPVIALEQDAASSPTVVAVSAFEFGPMLGDDPATTESGYFVYELDAGEEAIGSLRLANPGMEPVTVELAAVDAETAQRGGSAYAAADATHAAAGSWLQLGDARVTLDPGEQTAVEFTVKPPPAVAPGQYLAGIAAFVPSPSKEAMADETGQPRISVAMQTRYVIGVQVDVPGEWKPSLSVSGARILEQPSGTKLAISMSNLGDTFIMPQGHVTLSEDSGKTLLTHPIRLGTFLTGTDLDYLISWPGEPVGGAYAVEVELDYADGQVAHYSGELSISDYARAAITSPTVVDQPSVQPTAPVQGTDQRRTRTAIALALASIVGLLAIQFVYRRRVSSW